ncbi:uncharacterized protein LOC144009083 [Festucalex cinctus]
MSTAMSKVNWSLLGKRLQEREAPSVQHSSGEERRREGQQTRNADIGTNTSGGSPEFWRRRDLKELPDSSGRGGNEAGGWRREEFLLLAPCGTGYTSLEQTRTPMHTLPYLY